MKTKFEAGMKIFFISCFFGVIIILGVLTLENKTPVSELESRSLTQFPDLRYRKLSDAKYLKEIGDAFTDQLEARDYFVNQYFEMSYRVFHQTYLGSTVIGKNEYLFGQPYFVKMDKKHKKMLKKCADIINQTAERAFLQGTEFVFVNYPRKDMANYQYLPEYYPDNRKAYEEEIQYLKSCLSEKVRYIDVYQLFTENDSEKGPFYFQTDHHVNFSGTELIYAEIMKLIEEKYPDIRMYTAEDYDFRRFEVKGSFNRKIGGIIKPDPEALSFVPKGWEFPEYTRKENGKPSELPLITDRAADSYTTFMDGDRGETLIQIPGNKKMPNIGIVGSSFTNILEVMMIPSVHKMLSVDYRYNHSGLAVSDYIRKEDLDYVIFIPNTSIANLDYSAVKIYSGLGKG